jgi:hypothetical protein
MTQNAPQGSGGAAARCPPDLQAAAELPRAIACLVLFSFACGAWSGGLFVWLGAA